MNGYINFTNDKTQFDMGDSWKNNNFHKKIPTLGDTVTCIYVICINLFIQILRYVRDKNLKNGTPDLFFSI